MSKHYKEFLFFSQEHFKNKYSAEKMFLNKEEKEKTIDKVKFHLEGEYPEKRECVMARFDVLFRIFIALGLMEGSGIIEYRTEHGITENTVIKGKHFKPNAYEFIEKHYNTYISSTANATRDKCYNVLMDLLIKNMKMKQGLFNKSTFTISEELKKSSEFQNLILKTPVSEFEQKFEESIRNKQIMVQYMLMQNQAFQQQMQIHNQIHMQNTMMHHGGGMF